MVSESGGPHPGAPSHPCAYCFCPRCLHCPCNAAAPRFSVLTAALREGLRDNIWDRRGRRGREDPEHLPPSLEEAVVDVRRNGEAEMGVLELDADPVEE